MRFYLSYLIVFAILGIFSCTSDGEFWEVESRSEDKKNRKRVLAKKKNTNFQGGDCKDCIKVNDVLSLQFTNEYLDDADLSCTMEAIEILSVEIMNNLEERCYIPIISSDVKLSYSTTDTLNPPFDLLYQQKVDVKIPTECGSVFFNGEKGKVIISYQLLECGAELLIVSDTLVYEIGCPDLEEDDLLYSNHSTYPNNLEELLPYYSLGEYSVLMRGNVAVKVGGQAYLKVCDEDEGFIKVEKDSSSEQLGVKVEKGAFFKATGSKIK